MKTSKEKEKLLEYMQTTPVAQVACAKAGVGRSTYYRWRKESKRFAGLADKALFEGILLVNDLAESQVISAIKDKNLGAIKLWLQHHHKTYTKKLHITGELEYKQSLTKEQKQLIRDALKLSGIRPQKHGTKKQKD